MQNNHFCIRLKEQIASPQFVFAGSVVTEGLFLMVLMVILNNKFPYEKKEQDFYP